MRLVSFVLLLTAALGCRGSGHESTEPNREVQQREHARPAGETLANVDDHTTRGVSR